MNIALLFDLIDEAFGRSRLLQHSPVSPDVWEAYLDAPGEAGVEPRVDLLMTAASGSEPGQIADALRKGIEWIGRPPRDAAIAANSNSVVARLTLAELICVASPLTAWWQALPAELTHISSLRQAAKDENRTFNSSAEEEFFTFAATAGLVHLVVQGKGQRLQQEHYDKRASGAVPRTLPIGQRRRMNPDILEMLSAFDELLQQIEYLGGAPLGTTIEHIYPNRRSHLAVAYSRRTIKADASENLFHASAADITWAVVDCGIDARHECFARAEPPVPPEIFASRVAETYDFTCLRDMLSDPGGVAIDADLAATLQNRLTRGLAIDWSLLKDHLRILHDASYKPPVHDHGTHVGGIIGAKDPAGKVVGMCPDIRLMDIRVFDDEGTTDEFTILSALQFLGYLNSVSSAPAVHGANLSFSLAHKVRSFGCGRTPICVACERMVKEGIVVVAAAGNAGFTGEANRPSLEDRYALVTITDPGNAEAAITVGSTHKISPFAYGVSYFSSRGPTGDGRMKPDILAPGEKILSALPGNQYGEMDGTSMAAPHVSGAAAILLARYPELIGRPAKVKQVLCENATDLGRDRSFQGCGMVDVLRALQAQWER